MFVLFMNLTLCTLQQNGLEMDVFNQMKDIKEGMSNWQTPGKESDTSKIYELIQVRTEILF